MERRADISDLHFVFVSPEHAEKQTEGSESEAASVSAAEDEALRELVTLASRDPGRVIKLCPQCLSYVQTAGGVAAIFMTMYACNRCGWQASVPLEVNLDDLVKMPEEELRAIIRKWLPEDQQ